jgi:hypothetical protein
MCSFFTCWVTELGHVVPAGIYSSEDTIKNPILWFCGYKAPCCYSIKTQTLSFVGRPSRMQFNERLHLLGNRYSQKERSHQFLKNSVSFKARIKSQSLLCLSITY